MHSAGMTAGRFGRWASVLGINAVPVAGLALGGWSASTALALYWVENLVGGLLVAVRIALHRRLTGKRGHLRPQLGVQLTTGGRGREKEVQLGFLAEFTLGAVGLTVAQGLFLALLLGISPESDDVRRGALGVAAFQLLGFGADLVGLRERPFAWVKARAELALGRVVLVHLAILGGFFLASWREGEDVAFLPFALLKTLADLAAFLPTRRAAADPDAPPPAWLAGTMERLRPGDFAAHWVASKREAARLAAEDEEVGGAARPVAGTPAKAESKRRRRRR